MNKNIIKYNNVLSEGDIAYLLNLPAVITAKTRIEEKTSGSIYFTIELCHSIKQIIYYHVYH